MIVYDLVCGNSHAFEGWFASAEDFATQNERLLVRCPLCNDAQVKRKPAAKVRVRRAASAGSKSRRPRAAQLSTKEATPDTSTQVVGGEANLLAMLRNAVAQSEDVGAKFAEEARKIHYEEVPARSIRGQASAEEAKSLRDEGIDFVPLPDVLTKKLN